MRAPSVRSHTASAGVPAAARANHGAATISTNVSDTSVRHTKLDHSGCSPARIRPTNAHFAIVETSAATAPAASITMPLRSRATSTPNARR